MNPQSPSATIPKIIHQIWIGDQFRRPEKWMQIWADINPTWEYRIWTDTNLPPLSNQAAFDAMPHWAGRADILRYELLHRFGGVYVDADSTCIAPLDDDLCNNAAFAAFENEYIRPGLIANGVIGARPNCPLMQSLSEQIAALPNLGATRYEDVWKTTGPLFFTRAIGRGAFTFERLYPSYGFYPEHYTGVNYSGVVDRCYAQQFWGGAKRDVYEAAQPAP